jgi:hypothetical protein
MEAVVARLANLTLARAFSKWLDLWYTRVRKTIADTHYYGRLLDNAWAGWQEVSDLL